MGTCGVMFGSQERFQTQTQTKELEQAGLLVDYERGLGEARIAQFLRAQIRARMRDLGLR